MPRGGMCEIKNVPACHAERVYDTSFVAANHQRSISSWNVLSSGFAPELLLRRDTSEVYMPRAAPRRMKMSC
jgi:hypothetical protein